MGQLAQLLPVLQQLVRLIQMLAGQGSGGDPLAALQHLLGPATAGPKEVKEKKRPRKRRGSSGIAAGGAGAAGTAAADAAASTDRRPRSRPQRPAARRWRRRQAEAASGWLVGAGCRQAQGEDWTAPLASVDEFLEGLAAEPPRTRVCVALRDAEEWLTVSAACVNVPAAALTAFRPLGPSEAPEADEAMRMAPGRVDGQFALQRLAVRTMGTDAPGLRQAKVTLDGQRPQQRATVVIRLSAEPRYLDGDAEAKWRALRRAERLGPGRRGAPRHRGGASGAFRATQDA